MSRLENSTKNIFLNMSYNILESILGIVSRTVFISTLGSTYLGLAGLLKNVLGFLSISELGIATAIGFSLYKPLAIKDYDTVSALMTLYRKAYRIIAFIVLTCGIVLFFFLDFFIPINQQPLGTDFAYFVFLINTVMGYLLSYKTTLCNSDNKGYKLVPINMIIVILQTIMQIVCLLIYKNYIVYLLVLLFTSFIRMMWQNLYISRIYPQVDFDSKNKINKEVETQIKRNVGGLIIAKIGDYLVNSTDNLIITKLVSLVATGIYSNYVLIRGMVNGYISTIFSGISASMGNVVAIESDERKSEIFETLMFTAFFVYSFEAVCFMCLFNPFIGEIWLGNEYVFDTFTVSIIVINNYLTGLRMPLITMKGAAGKYMEDAWIPFAFSAINLIASIILVRYLGVAGVFLGTIIGSLLTVDWYRPIIIYKHVLHKSVLNYYRMYIKYVILGFLYLFVVYNICNCIIIPNKILKFTLKAILAGCLPITFNIILFNKTKEFELIKQMFSRIIFKLKNKMGVIK